MKRLFGQSIALVVNGYNSPKSQNQRRCELCAQPQVDAKVQWVGFSLGIKGKDPSVHRVWEWKVDVLGSHSAW